MNVLADVRCGGYLAFVDPRVSDLRVLDLERPVFTGWLIDRPEALVTGVRVPADGQQVNVPVSDPGDLQWQNISVVVLLNLLLLSSCNKPYPIPD